MPNNLSIRGYFVTFSKLSADKSVTFYQELGELMEEEFIDFGYLVYKPFPIETTDPNNNNEPVSLRVTGVLGSLKPPNEEMRIRNEIGNFMKKWHMESMFFCWSRLKFEPSFGQPKLKDGLSDIQVVGE